MLMASTSIAALITKANYTCVGQVVVPLIKKEHKTDMTTKR